MFLSTGEATVSSRGEEQHLVSGGKACTSPEDLIFKYLEKFEGLTWRI